MHRLVLILALAACSRGQRVDDSYEPKIDFQLKRKARVLVDHAHGNMHAIDASFAPFAKLLRKSGAQLDSLDVPLTPEALRAADIFVVVSATKSFDQREVATLTGWVNQGGGLLLIGDHPPWATVLSELAADYGASVARGWLSDTDGKPAPLVFHQVPVAALNWTSQKSTFPDIATFVGCGFQGSADWRPLLSMDETSLLHEGSPKDKDAPAHALGKGWMQGAVRNVQSGRVALFCEAGMFTAQLGGLAPDMPMGLNSPLSLGNEELIVALVQYLAGPREGLR